ncbi:unnamed protein product [uncultured bacterium]|nr:unnamed protein product [uncultured bacterium]
MGASKELVPQLAIVRPAEDLASLARQIKREYQAGEAKEQESKEHYRNCGLLLIAARKQCKERRESWLAWLKKNVAFSQPTASAYIRLAENWDDPKVKAAFSLTEALRQTSREPAFRPLPQDTNEEDEETDDDLQDDEVTLEQEEETTEPRPVEQVPQTEEQIARAWDRFLNLSTQLFARDLDTVCNRLNDVLDRDRPNSPLMSLMRRPDRERVEIADRMDKAARDLKSISERIRPRAPFKRKQFRSRGADQ